MPTTVNRDNYDQVQFEMADAAPDSCLTQPMREEIKRGLRGFISKVRNAIGDLLRRADQPDNILTVTQAGELMVPGVKQWVESYEVSPSGEKDITFDQFAGAGIDATAAFITWRVSGNPAHYGKVHFKSITKDEVIVTVTSVTGDLELFLHFLEPPKAGTNS